MNTRVIMHSMIIESERGAPANDDNPFNFQEPLAEVEQVPAQFVYFPTGAPHTAASALLPATI
jgi:hypothetical protein